MESYYQILKVNLKFNLVPHIFIAFVLVLAAPMIMGLENLNPTQVAQTLEVYTSLLGIILMIPIFVPDQDSNIRDLMASKKEPMIKIHFIRMMESLFFLSIMVVLFLLRLQYGQSTFPFGKYFYGTMANCIFLGGLGVFTFSIIDHLAVSYMIPILYYILNYGSGEKLGMFNMFSMMRGSFIEKNYLFSIGLVLLIVAVTYRHCRRE